MFSMKLSPCLTSLLTSSMLCTIYLFSFRNQECETGLSVGLVAGDLLAERMETSKSVDS
jgi:hypothetical protein